MWVWPLALGAGHDLALGFRHVGVASCSCVLHTLCTSQVSAVCAALVDRNVLVQRAALDVVSILFPFHQSFLLLPDLTSILTAALHTLLKRDVSLSRRLYSWLLGTQVDKSSIVNCIQPPSSSGDLPASASDSDSNVSLLNALDTSYFDKYSKAFLTLSLGGIMSHAKEATRQNLSKVECVLPYRILRALQERPEIGVSTMESIMFELLSCLKEQIDGLGGVYATQGKDTGLSKSKSVLLRDGNAKKSSGKKGSLKADIIQSANLLLGSLSQEFVWGWMEGMLERCILDMQSRDSGERRRRGSSVDGVEGRRGSGGGGVEEGSIPPHTPSVPVSESRIQLDGELTTATAITTTTTKGKSPDLKSMLALFVFLMQIIPKVNTM